MEASRPRTYSTLQIALHWIIAALIVFQILVHDGMEDAFRASMRGTDPGDDLLWANVHAAVGIAVLVLAVIRLAIRLTRGAPAMHRDKPEALIWVAKITHLLLYVLIFFLPVSGAAAWFFSLDPPAEAHEVAKTLLLIVVGVHLLGALAEHFFFRNDSLLRMLGRPSPRS
ncbi:MAG: cytochrome b [Rhizobiaceae bacterium]